MATKKAKQIKELEISTGQKSMPQNLGLMEQIEFLKASGQTNTDEFREKARELEVILGIDQINPFGTNELDIFEDQLRSMTLSDVQKLAERVGINHHHDKSTLKTILIKEFKAVNRNNRRNIMPNSVNTFKLDPNNPQHAQTIKILGEF